MSAAIWSLTSNSSFTRWASALADDWASATANLNRLLHHANIVRITGESDRLSGKRKVS